jgi:Carboxypeptidase regulatory-like domain
MFTRSLRISFGALMICATAAWGATATLEGSVADRNGKILPGADIRIEGSGGSKGNKVVKADLKGHYACDGLTVGSNYRVIVLVNGAVKASMNVKMTPGTTQLNFNLDNVGLVSGSGKGKHKVWVEPKTGSNVGGHWIEVDDDDAGNATTRASDRPH